MHKYIKFDNVLENMSQSSSSSSSSVSKPYVDDSDVEYVITSKSEKVSLVMPKGIAKWRSSGKKSAHKNDKRNLWIGNTVPPRFIPITADNKPYSIVQTVEFYSGSSPLSQTTSFVNIALAYDLQLFTQASSFGAIFDQYRIAEVEIEFRPRFNVGVSGMTTPILYTVIDYDDQVALTGGATTYLAYTNCTTSMFETVVRRWVPHCTRGILDTSGLVATENATAPWLDMADATVLHYGIKVGIDAGSGSSPQSWTVVSRVLLQLRNVR